MARYDVESDVAYVEGKMSEARDYREKQANKQEKFAKRLQLADWAITGANWAINKKADALEADKVTKRAWYNTALENSKKWQTMHTEYEDLGYTREQMFLEEKKKQLNAHLQKELGEGYSLTNYQLGVKRIAKEFSDKQVNFESWNKALDAQLNIPNLTAAELATIIKEDGAAPRSIASFLGNKMLKVAKSHDKETLKNEDAKETNAMLGGLVGEKFAAAKVALKDYKAKGNPIDELVKWMKTDEGKAIVTAKDVSFEIKTVTKPDKWGGMQEVPVVVTGGIGKDGLGFIMGTEVGNAALISSSPAPEYVPSSAEINTTIGEVDTFVGTLDKELIDVYEDMYPSDPNKKGLAKNVLITAKNIRRNDAEGKIEQAKAIQIATKFLLAQEAEFKDTNMSLYDIAKIDKTIPVDSNDIESFVTSIKETKPSYAWTQEITTMRDDFFANIDMESKLDIDAKARAKQDIDNYLETIGITKDTTPVQENIPSSVEDTYTQGQINRGVPERETRLKLHGKLREELKSLNRSLGFIDRQTLSGTEYQEVEKQIVKNKIKAEAFEKKFGTAPNKVFPEIYGDSTKTPKYTDKLLNEMIEFLNS